MINWKHIIIKVLCILLFIFIFYKLSDYSLFNDTNSNVETFENSIENEKKNYLKLRETYIESKDKSLELLYANYSGEEVGHDVWENKTLDQCTDICNNIEGCVGFTRDLVLDTEPAKCHPHNMVDKCYSNRKGDLTQMQNAIKYNSFVKSNVPNILNKCIGDLDLTLNRTIFIKSYSMPNSFLGVSGDSRVVLIDKNKPNFKSSCNFRIEQGKDGVGTISFLHIDTGKYLLRDSNNNLILNNITSGMTEYNQRASFNLYDSNVGSGSVIFKAMTMIGETTDKFITLDGNYLSIKTIPDINKNNSNIYDNFTFYIVDSIIDSNIITNKSNIPVNTLSSTTMNTIPMMTAMPTMSTIPTIDNNTMTNTMTNTMPTMSDTDTQESFTSNFDSTSNIPLYNNLFTKPTNFVLTDYLQDNYKINNVKNATYTSISKKYNDILINNQLSNSLTKNIDEYNSIYNLNLEIEKEISNLNLDLNAKNDKLINGLDKMRITDIANDYFFLKNISNKQ